ncbi:MAG: hypothetical protein WD904_14575 [Dehalococcoidia bacterium]
MKRDLPVASPAQAFQTAIILHFAYTMAVIIYIVAGELMRVTITDFAPEGFTNYDDQIWALRAVFAALSFLGLFATHVLYADSRVVDGLLKRGGEVTDASVLMRLQTVHILKLGWTGSIAIFGLVLYVFNADRLDLYSFCLVALANFILILPQRDQWEAIFRRVATEHSGVSSMPWWRHRRRLLESPAK